MTIENEPEPQTPRPKQDPTKLFLWLMIPLGTLFALLLLLGKR